MTATANTAFTAAQFNTHVRDNLNQTAPAKATTAGSIFATTGTSAIAERIPGVSTVLTSESTTSNTYVALATAQAVTVTTGTQAIVVMSAQSAQATPGNTSNMSYAVSGASTVAAADDWSTVWQTTTSNYFGAFSRVNYHTGLTAGSNTFTAQFKTSGGTSANFRNRQLFVIPL